MLTIQMKMEKEKRIFAFCPMNNDVWDFSKYFWEHVEDTSFAKSKDDRLSSMEYVANCLMKDGYLLIEEKTFRKEYMAEWKKRTIFSDAEGAIDADNELIIDEADFKRAMERTKTDYTDCELTAEDIAGGRKNLKEHGFVVFDWDGLEFRLLWDDYDFEAELKKELSDPPTMYYI